MGLSLTLYPDCYNEWGFDAPSNYQPIINHFGEVLVQVDDDDYQGDTRVLYKREDGYYGYLQFGWGSCSGCDALQGCDSEEELDELISNLESSIIWFPILQEVENYFKNHDWEGDYSWESEEQQLFIKKVLDFIREKKETERLLETIPEYYHKMKTFLEVTPVVMEYIPDLIRTGREASNRLAKAEDMLEDVLGYFRKEEKEEDNGDRYSLFEERDSLSSRISSFLDNSLF